jgi:hypothetical protein
MNCGRPYRWTRENPPQLALFVVAERHDVDDSDDE